MHTTDATSPTDSLLLQLPSELRQRIFYLSFLPSVRSQPATIKTAACTYLSLQLTSRVVSNETYLLPFQHLPLALPCTFGTNASSLLQSLRKWNKQQIHAVRSVEVHVLGSVYEAEEAARVVRILRDGTEDSRDRWNRIGLSPDIAIVFGDGGRWGEQQQAVDEEDDSYESKSGSELRELSLRVTARDLMAPMADSALGMEKTLDTETSPFFVELAKGVADGKFQRLRRVNMNIELGPSLKDAYPREEVMRWEHSLWSKLNLPGHGETASDNSGEGGENGDVRRTGLGVQVQVMFKPSSLGSAAEYFTALGGDGGWWTGNTTSTRGWNGTAAATWGGVGIAMMRLSAPARRPS